MVEGQPYLLACRTLPCPRASPSVACRAASVASDDRRLIMRRTAMSESLQRQGRMCGRAGRRGMQAEKSGPIV